PSPRPRSRRLSRALRFPVAKWPLTFLLNLINAALHVEICFRHVVVFAFENFLKPTHGLRNRHILAFMTGKNFRDMEWLTKEALNLTRPVNCELVFRRQIIIVHTTDDVL